MLLLPDEDKVADRPMQTFSSNTSKSIYNNALSQVYTKIKHFMSAESSCIISSSSNTLFLLPVDDGEASTSNRKIPGFLGYSCKSNSKLCCV